MKCSPIFLLMGPTGTGKTEVALELAENFPVEIISVDSAMVYQGLNIGTAKPEKDTLAAIPHHMINICSPTAPYSVACFYQDIQVIIKDIQERAKIPLLVGGTMMYFNTLLQGLAQIPPIDPNIRLQLLQRVREEGASVLHQELAQLDSISAAKLHPNDAQRVTRALEIFYGLGKPMSVWLSESVSTSLLSRWGKVNAFAIVPIDRQSLHQRLEVRLEQMLNQGFVDEVIDLKDKYSLHAALPAMRSIGYRQIWNYLEGDYDYQALVYKILVATRQFAKRQSTWLRHWSGCLLNRYDNPKDILNAMQKELIKMHQT